MHITIDVSNSTAPEFIYNGKAYKVFLGFPCTVYMFGDGAVQYFETNTQNISLRNARKTFPDMPRIIEAAKHYKGGTIDFKKFMSSIDKLIKKKKLLPRDKTFLKRMLNQHANIGPLAFRSVLIQGGYAKVVNDLKYISPDAMLDKTCSAFEAFLENISRALSELRTEDKDENTDTHGGAR